MVPRNPVPKEAIRKRINFSLFITQFKAIFLKASLKKLDRGSAITFRFDENSIIILETNSLAVDTLSLDRFGKYSIDCGRYQFPD